MRVVVAIKHILDPAGMTVNRKAEKVFINRPEYIINPADRCALEAALQLRDVTGCEVVAVCGGPSSAGDALRQAWAMGADRGVHLMDEVFAKADGLVAARLLAAAVRKLGPVDLVLAGERALDTGAGEVGPRLAEALGWPHILAAHSIQIADGTVKAVAALGKQFMAVETACPAVVMVAENANKPRYGNAARVINSYREWSPEVRTAIDLGLGETELVPAVEKRGQSFPTERQPGTLLADANELAVLLKRQRLV